MHTERASNRFEDFYHRRVYTLIKNSLYNYRLRKATVTRYLRTQTPGKILEVGCGVSPVGNRPERTVFTDLSWQAVTTLRQVIGKGNYVVADGACLPFKTGRFTHTICSEVLEHIPNDQATMIELGRVTDPDGEVIVTIPHRQCYFAYDDLYVGHFRRYERQDIRRLMQAAGCRIAVTEKILGPLEKPLMLTAVAIFRALTVKAVAKNTRSPLYLLHVLQFCFRLVNTLLMGVVWLEARLLPVSFATVLMIVGRKRNSPGTISV